MSSILAVNATGLQTTTRNIQDEISWIKVGPDNFDYQNRSISEAFRVNDFYWPRSGLNSDPSSLCCSFVSKSGLFSRPTAASFEKARSYYFRGTVKNQSGTPLYGATVSCYLTSTKTLISEVATDDRGYYEVPTPYSGQNHYLVARYASGSLAGVSVDTIQPSL